MIDAYTKKRIDDAITKIETIIEALQCMSKLIDGLDVRVEKIEAKPKPKPRSRKQA